MLTAKKRPSNLTSGDQTNSMNVQEALAHVIKHQHLTQEQASAVMRQLMTSEATPSQVGALLTAMHMKGATVDEITGFAQTMRAMATFVETTRRPLVDTCGTGGDHSGTFNISTTAAFVVAGAGVAVAKHGNRSATSRCGSADVLEYLGVNIDADAACVGRCIDEAGLGFLFARTLHGSMKNVAPVRMELKIRTVFNILGPLTNPAGADGQVIGVFDANLVETLALVLQALGSRHVFVVAGLDGLDELTLSGPSRVSEATEETIKTYEITPEQFGLQRAEKEAFLGGAPEENARILKAVLQGETGAYRDIVLLNAAPALVAGGKADTLDEGICIARESIDSGVALQVLEDLVRVSNE